MLDDMNSMLGQDIFGALQDNTITEDTTILCTDNPRKESFKSKKSTCTFVRAGTEYSENPLQFGFENIVFEIDNRCDDQKTTIEPIRYCSLAKFVEGNDIARKSVKVRLKISKTYNFQYR